MSTQAPRLAPDFHDVDALTPFASLRQEFGMFRAPSTRRSTGFCRTGTSKHAFGTSSRSRILLQTQREKLLAPQGLSGRTAQRPLQISQYSTAARIKTSQAPPEKEESFSELLDALPGTVQAHRCLVLLNSALPITEFPSRYTTKIQRELQLRLIRLGGIVNFAWFGEPAHGETGNSPADGEEAISGVAYTPGGGRLLLPHISLSTIDSVVKQLVSHMEATSLQPETHEHIDILVCTHGARDCRCGEKGGRVYEVLKEEVKKMQKEGVVSPKVRVGEVAHVGGHKYAANVLVYPHGEWLGLVQPEDVPTILRRFIPSPDSPGSLPGSVRPLGRDDPLLVPQRWRGRMGLGKDEQIEMFGEAKAAGGA